MRGAYGISLERGPSSDHVSLPTAPSHWPAWKILVDRDRSVGCPSDFRLPLLTGGVVDFDMATRTATIGGDAAPAASPMMHPWLSGIGAVTSYLRGQLNFHAGGFVVEGAVWVIIGAKEAGKSTALVHMWLHDHVVTADDLVVIDGGLCLSGPGCVDLRAPAAEYLGVGAAEDLGQGRLRHRVWTGAPPAELPLGGFVVPSWSEDTSVHRLPPADTLGIMVTARSMYRAAGGGEENLMRALSLPTLQWNRVRDLAQLDRAREVLIDGIYSVATNHRLKR